MGLYLSRSRLARRRLREGTCQWARTFGPRLFGLQTRSLCGERLDSPIPTPPGVTCSEEQCARPIDSTAVGSAVEFPPTMPKGMEDFTLPPTLRAQRGVKGRVGGIQGLGLWAETYHA